MVARCHRAALLVLPGWGLDCDVTAIVVTLTCHVARRVGVLGVLSFEEENSSSMFR